MTGINLKILPKITKLGVYNCSDELIAKITPHLTSVEYLEANAHIIRAICTQHPEVKDKAVYLTRRKTPSFRAGI